MVNITVFYSWQSDSPKHTNRDFIEEAAQIAIEQIVSNNQLSIDAALDRDTQDIPGSPAIADAILHKINQCGVFLCDVTLISPKNAPRLTPNPNVMIELGYAIAKIGWERIICVMNEEFGGPSKLPFDLQHRRWPIRYRLSPNTDASPRNEEKQQLVQNLELALRTVLFSGLLIPSVNPKDRRVAFALRRSLTMFRSVLYAFLLEHQGADTTKVFEENHSDFPGTQFPATELVEPILNTLSKSDFRLPSNIQIGEIRLNWAEALIHELTSLSQGCNVILDRYADRDEQIVAIVEEIEIRSQNLALMIKASITQPSLRGLYDAGVPDIHVDWYRYFLLTVLKASRIIREFSGD